MIEATARILETGGPVALSTNAVAERAGVSIGSLYQYFPNKIALLVGLVRSERRSLLVRLTHLAENPPDRLDGVVAELVRAAVTHQYERPALARTLDYLEPGMPPDGESDVLPQEPPDLVGLHSAVQGVATAPLAARDLVALTKGMVDAAGLAGETDRAAVEARIVRAVAGYLG